MTVVDVASRFKEAEPITSKTAERVKEAAVKIYSRSPLEPPKVLKVDAGSEFKGSFKKWIESKGVVIQTGEPGVHRSQGIVERFNRTLPERLFGHQYALEMLDPTERSKEWVTRLPDVVKALNEEKTRLIASRIRSTLLKKK